MKSTQPLIIGVLWPVKFLENFCTSLTVPYLSELEERADEIRVESFAGFLPLGLVEPVHSAEGVVRLVRRIGECMLP